MDIKKEHWSPLLLDWFAAHGRDLPWRDESPRDPYKVWVSEIMLQQTKVETVRPYYDSWMDHFPTIPALAAASQDEVLRQWQAWGTTRGPATSMKRSRKYRPNTAAMCRKIKKTYSP